MEQTVTFALAKGRLAEEAIELLERRQVDCSCLREKSRRLVFETEQGYRFMLVKPSDVPTYVDHGVADIGIVGKDTLMEENRPLYEMLDLGFGACRICVGRPAGDQPAGQPPARGHQVSAHRLGRSSPKGAPPSRSSASTARWSWGRWWAFRT